MPDFDCLLYTLARRYMPVCSLKKANRFKSLHGTVPMRVRICLLSGTRVVGNVRP